MHINVIITTLIIASRTKRKLVKSFEESFLEDDTLEKMVMKHKKLKKEAKTIIPVIKKSTPPIADVNIIEDIFPSEKMDKFSVLSIQAENSLKKIKETLNEIGTDNANAMF